MAKKRSAKTKYTKKKAPKVRIGKSKSGVSLGRPKKEIKCMTAEEIYVYLTLYEE